MAVGSLNFFLAEQPAQPLNLPFHPRDLQTQPLPKQAHSERQSMLESFVSISDFTDPFIAIIGPLMSRIVKKKLKSALNRSGRLVPLPPRRRRSPPDLASPAVPHRPNLTPRSSVDVDLIPVPQNLLLLELSHCPLVFPLLLSHRVLQERKTLPLLDRRKSSLQRRAF